ncbi:hypothetical protein A2926_02425 [Candidatus Giovannonibacteria bacterium RIFCSPLOWO2_01_FULL_44_40]|uniref:GxxExxY protein n=1 Tax=Candidatus Giovannonibacteria bacterium RIFCSPHIGHO2_01_FULL_45_23 TaxID=1798325 RepID=A0A1F5VHM5_9BACT|nr:MAG: hypothetical protein A2834_02540 [Candidatus Giovannonibacteria bacterium RIFCSPHIGHO2_01_FULL_45_23]OGF75585.1 MAG: hypothetical protein A3C77_02025 [Candidatus Giovannonibacteria bacterium RIFCSPHIGHO2_02_FULL_45_13]OGF80004.1 MAG: hypothetical protein A2926_02425 [Candidatus Giovannonibacteria bacterium RIFCSPLOWO2_01_FULL_44_40]
MQQMDKVLYPELSYKVCGLCFKIHNDLGQFRSEKSYADALEEVLKLAGISYRREQSLGASFAGENDRRNIPDFIIEDKIVVDLKAKRIVSKEDYYQMKRYLVASDKKLGLIVNFRQKYLSPKRILN